MSRAVTDSLANCALGSLGQIGQLIDALPEGLWTKTAGAWPVWQHIVHAAWACDFFSQAPYVPAPASLSQDVIQLKAVEPKAPDKAEIKKFVEGVTEKVKTFFASLDDSKLALPNEPLAKIGLKWDIAQTLSSISSHCAYHLGYGDALLRSEGLAGVF
jgi:hypothetical protein